MTKEIARELKTINDKINDLGKRICEQSDMRTETINSNMSQMSSDISGTWKPKEIYTADTYIMHDGELYVCLIQNVNTEPSANPIFWKKTDIASELNKLLSLIKGEN